MNKLPSLDALEKREHILSAEIKGIDGKISRLLTARKERSLGLQRIRAEQAKAILGGGQVGTLPNESR